MKFTQEKNIKDHNFSGATYKDSGVDVEAGYELVDSIKPFVEKTRRPEILSGLGSFSALSRIPKHIDNPILVTCTDGVGTKLKLALEQRKLKYLGFDVIGYSLNKKQIDTTKIYYGDQIDEFLNNINILICTVPYTSKTNNLLSSDLFKFFKF